MDKAENIESFNEEFCSYLQGYLLRVFALSDRKQISFLWCDRVMMPSLDSEVSKKSVSKNRQIITKALLLEGNARSSECDLIFNFEKYSLRRYARGTSLIDCLPIEDSTDLINIDLENYIICIQLR